MGQTKTREDGDKHGSRSIEAAAPRSQRRVIEIQDACGSPVLLQENLEGADLVIDDLETFIRFDQLQCLLRELSGWFGVESIEQALGHARDQLDAASHDLESWSRSAKYLEEYRRIVRLIDALRPVKQTLAAIRDSFGLTS